jgi:hypothetical protein
LWGSPIVGFGPYSPAVSSAAAAKAALHSASEMAAATGI